MKISSSHGRNGAVLQVLAVLAGICLIGLSAIAFAVYSTVTVGSDMRAVRNVAAKEAHLRFAQQWEGTAHPLLVDVARFGLSFAHLQPEARLAIQSVRGAEVGFYELTTPPNDATRQRLFRDFSQRLEQRGWSRTVSVLDREDLVMVFVPNSETSAQEFRAFVVVLNERQLVLVSGRANLEPMAELVESKLNNHLSGPLLAHAR